MTFFASIAFLLSFVSLLSMEFFSCLFVLLSMYYVLTAEPS